MKKLLAAVAAATTLTVAPSMAFASSRHNGGATSQTGCALSATGVGAPLVLTGSGYAAGGNYQIYFWWPQSAGGVHGSEAYATADSAGNIVAQDYAYWAGTYTADVAAGTKTLATCSLSVG